MTNQNAVAEDRGPYLLTRGSRKFFLMDPRPGEFDITDIAGALSRLCRFNGHISDRYEDEIYSVAQHSVYVLQALRLLAPAGATPPGELWGLLHDAPEAMYGDNITPIKRVAPALVEMEDHGAEALRTQFDVPFNWFIEKTVKQADTWMLYAEMSALTDSPMAHFGGNPKTNDIHEIDPNFYPWSPRYAREQFLANFEELTGKTA